MVTTKISNSIFIPFQPEIERKADNYVEYKPTQDVIMKDVAYFYQFRTRKHNSDHFSLVPDGCFDIIFECSSVQPRVYLLTSPEKRMDQAGFRPDCEYFGIRFLPEQKVLRLDHSMKDLLNKITPLEDVIHSIPFLAEEVYEKTSFKGRINFFKSYLKTLEHDDNIQSIVNYCIKRIYQSNGMLSILQLAIETGYSDRYLRKMFEENIGFSPKQLSEVVRFQNTLNVICREEIYDLQDLVTDNGYHDLPHFIRGFKKFVNLTPNKFIKKITS